MIFRLSLSSLMFPHRILAIRTVHSLLRDEQHRLLVLRLGYRRAYELEDIHT